MWLKKDYLWGTITHRRHAGDVVNGKAGATPCLERNSRVAAAGAESVGPTASSLCVCKGHDVVVFVFFKKSWPTLKNWIDLNSKLFMKKTHSHGIVYHNPTVT